MKYPEDFINKVICGDCLEVMKDIPDKSIDLVITDPPYGINYQSNMRVMSDKFDKLAGDNDLSRLIAYDEIYRVLKNDCVAIIFCSFKNYAEDYKKLEEKFSIKNTIIWDKGGGGIGDLVHSLLTDYEMAIIAHKGMCAIRGKRDGSVWQEGKVFNGDMEHPTEKPVNLIERMIYKFSDDGNLILDCFAGGGSTLLACRNSKRRFIGIEISPKYCKIAEDRLRQGLLI
jgi:site-specific DNA-methyltransferase (adenine-specific)